MSNNTNKEGKVLEVILTPAVIGRGRPSEYDPEYINSVDEYLAETVDKTINGRVKVNLPTIEDFARYIGVSKKSLYNWRDIHPDFLHALEKIENEQRKRLLNSGLAGEYNPTIAKLVLSANHGMREKSDITSDDKPLEGSVTINNYKSLSDDELIAIARNGRSGAGD